MWELIFFQGVPGQEEGRKPQGGGGASRGKSYPFEVGKKEG